jgi:transcriptional regulator with XRE-family HTH domain
MNIGKAIRELRRQQQLSQDTLARQSGITQAALSAIEKKGVRPNNETLQNLCKALNVPESLLYVIGMEKIDIPQQKQLLYDELFPIIQSLVMKIASPD